MHPERLVRSAAAGEIDRVSGFLSFSVPDADRNCIYRQVGFPAD
jgi:hypothetical protein